MKTNQARFFYWAPRVLGILLVLFLELFSLDVFGMPGTTQELILGFLVHSLPSMLLILLLVISWRWELVGAIVYPLLGLAYSLSNLTEHWSVHAAITAPLVLIGLLFLLSWNKRRRQPAAV